MRLWKNVRDYQGTNFAIGRTMTAEGWADQALDWASHDGWDEEDLNFLENLADTGSEENLIEYINDVWDIQIKPEEEWTEEEKQLEEVSFWHS